MTFLVQNVSAIHVFEILEKCYKDYLKPECGVIPLYPLFKTDLKFYNPEDLL